MDTAEVDEALMARIADGDDRAFACLVDRHAGRYLALAQRLMGDRAEAEDLVQEAFTTVWVRPDRFDPGKARFTTWFYRVVTNRCLDQKRRKRPAALPDDYDAVDKGPAPDDGLIGADRQALLTGALDGLPERQRAAVTLCYLQGLSNADAAAALDIHVRALESLLARARRKLKALLAPMREDLLQGEEV